MVSWVKAGKGRRRDCWMVASVKTQKTGFGITYVISLPPCKYPGASLLSSTFPGPRPDLTVCSSASPRGNRRGGVIPTPLHVLHWLLECFSPFCLLICPSIIMRRVPCVRHLAKRFIYLTYIHHNPMRSVLCFLLFIWGVWVLQRWNHWCKGMSAKKEFIHSKLLFLTTITDAAEEGPALGGLFQHPQKECPNPPPTHTIQVSCIPFSENTYYTGLQLDHGVF